MFDLILSYSPHTSFPQNRLNLYLNYRKNLLESLNGVNIFNFEIIMIFLKIYISVETKRNEIKKLLW